MSLPPETRTLVPLADGRRPPLPSIVPALTASSLSFPMASINSLGGKPHFSADLTIIMNRIVTPPLCVFVFPLQSCISGRPGRECNSGATVTSNSGPLNRQRPDENFADVSPAAANAHRLRSCRGLGAGVRLVYLAKLTFTATDYLEEILDQFDDFFLGICLEDGEAADYLLRLGERPVGHCMPAVGKANACP